MTARKTTTPRKPATKALTAAQKAGVAAAIKAGKPIAPPPKPIAPGQPGFNWFAEYPNDPLDGVFTFTSSEGVTVGLPRFTAERAPKPGVLRKLRKHDRLEQMFSVMEMIASPAALDVSDSFSDADYAAMYAAWTEWAEASTPDLSLR